MKKRHLIQFAVFLVIALAYAAIRSVIQLNAEWSGSIEKKVSFINWWNILDDLTPSSSHSSEPDGGEWQTCRLVILCDDGKRRNWDVGVVEWMNFKKGQRIYKVKGEWDPMTSMQYDLLQSRQSLEQAQSVD